MYGTSDKSGLLADHKRVDAVGVDSLPSATVSSSKDDGDEFNDARVAKPRVEEPEAAETARSDLWGAGESDLPGLPEAVPSYRYEMSEAAGIIV